MRALAILLFGLFMSVSSAAWADDPAPDVQGLINQQLDAFARGDAKAAFALAAPLIQQKFTDADTFLSMVKSGYPAVYHHRSVQFGKNSRDGDEISQAVVFIDDDNKVWDGVYKLSRQADGSWRIEGCVLQQSADTSL